MNLKKFTIHARLWRWPGDMPWHFINIDKEASAHLRDAFPKASMIKVTASIDNTSWRTSLFRNNRDNSYLLPIKKDIRRKEGLQDGDEIKVDILIL